MRRKEREDTAKNKDKNGEQGKIRSNFSDTRKEFSKRDWPTKEDARRRRYKHDEAEMRKRRPREQRKEKGKEAKVRWQEKQEDTSDDLPPKKEDPGTFAFYCCIGNILQCDALADLGSCANVLPLSMYKRGRLGELKLANTILRLADSTAKYPEGIVQNVKVKVGDMYFLADFTVLDTTENVTLPVIFGRPFLATINAIINVAKGEVEIGDGRMKKKIIYSAKIKHQAPTTPIPNYVLENVRRKKREYEEELCKEEEEEALRTKLKMEEALRSPWRGEPPNEDEEEVNLPRPPPPTP